MCDRGDQRASSRAANGRYTACRNRLLGQGERIPMGKIAPMGEQSIVNKPRRRSGLGVVLLLALLLISSPALLAFGFFAPAKLAVAQEHIIGLFHGGVAGIEEHTFVDACARTQDDAGPQAVTRTVRTTL